MFHSDFFTHTATLIHGKHGRHFYQLHWVLPRPALLALPRPDRAGEQHLAGEQDSPSTPNYLCIQLISSCFCSPAILESWTSGEWEDKRDRDM